MSEDSEIAEAFKGWRKHGQEKRKANLENSTRILKEKGVVFEENNLGVHLIVESSEGKIDFWPSTGLWIVRSSKKKGRGVFNLIREINK